MTSSSSSSIQHDGYFFNTKLDLTINDKVIKGLVSGIVSSYQQISDIILKKVLYDLYYHYFDDDTKVVLFNTTWTLDEQKVDSYFEKTNIDQNTEIVTVTYTSEYVDAMKAFIDSLVFNRSDFLLTFAVENGDMRSPIEVRFVPTKNISADIVKILEENLPPEILQNILVIELYETSRRQRRLSPEEVFHFGTTIKHLFINIVLASTNTFVGFPESQVLPETNLSTYDVSMFLKGQPLLNERMFYYRRPERFDFLGTKNIQTAYFEQINNMHRFKMEERYDHYSFKWDLGAVASLFPNLYIHLVDIRGLPIASAYFKNADNMVVLLEQIINEVTFDELGWTINRMQFFLDPNYGSLVLERDLVFLSKIGLQTIHARVEMREICLFVDVLKLDNKWISTRHPIAFPFGQLSRLRNLIGRVNIELYYADEKISDTTTLVNEAHRKSYTRITVIEHAERYTTIQEVKDAQSVWVPRASSLQPNLIIVEKDLDFLPFNCTRETKLAVQQFEPPCLVDITRNCVRFVFIDEHDRRRVSLPYYGAYNKVSKLFKIAQMMSGIPVANIHSIEFRDERNNPRNVTRDISMTIPRPKDDVFWIMKPSAALSVVVGEETPFVFAHTTNLQLPHEFKKFRELVLDKIVPNAFSLLMDRSRGPIQYQFQTYQFKLNRYSDWTENMRYVTNLTMEQPFLFRAMTLKIEETIEGESLMNQLFRKLNKPIFHPTEESTLFKITFPDNYILEWAAETNVVTREQDILHGLKGLHQTFNSDMSRLLIEIDHMSRFNASASKQLAIAGSEFSQIQIRVSSRFVKINLAAVIRRFKGDIHEEPLRCFKQIPNLVDKLHCPTQILLGDLFDAMIRETEEANTYDRSSDEVSKALLDTVLYDMDTPLHVILNSKYCDTMEEMTFIYSNLSDNKADYFATEVPGTQLFLPEFSQTKQTMLLPYKAQKLSTSMQVFDIDPNLFKVQHKFPDLVGTSFDNIDKDNILSVYFSVARKFEYLLSPAVRRNIADPRAVLFLQNFLSKTPGKSTLKVNFEKGNQILKTVDAHAWESIFSAADNFYLFIVVQQEIAKDVLFDSAFSAVRVITSTGKKTSYFALSYNNPPLRTNDTFKQWVSTFEDELKKSTVITLSFDNAAYNDEAECFNLFSAPRGLSYGVHVLDSAMKRQFNSQTLFQNCWFLDLSGGTSVLKYAIPVIIKQLAFQNNRSLFTSCMLFQIIKNSERATTCLPLISKQMECEVETMVSNILNRMPSVMPLNLSKIDIKKLIIFRDNFVNQGLWPFKVFNDVELQTLLDATMQKVTSLQDLIIMIPELLMISGNWSFKNYYTKATEDLWMQRGVWKYLIE
jgi:hypothetical protein